MLVTCWYALVDLSGIEVFSYTGQMLECSKKKLGSNVSDAVINLSDVIVLSHTFYILISLLSHNVQILISCSHILVKY